MPRLTPSAVRKQIAAGDTGPLYVLVGEDPTEQAAVAGEFADIVEEDLRAFNVERLYGGEMKADDLQHAAATLPMMAPRRVVLVLEAEKLLIPKRESKAADEALERLARFFQAPPPHATVVLVCGALDMRRRVCKVLERAAVFVDCGTIVDTADAERWVKVRAANIGAPLDGGAVRALVQRVGKKIVRLRAGLERLELYAMGQPVITAEDVRQAVSPAPEEQDNFGIADAIKANAPSAALHQLHLTLEAGWTPFAILGQLRVAAERLPPKQMRQGMDAVLRTDLALKSSGGDQRILLERLVVELCQPVPRATRRPS